MKLKNFIFNKKIYKYIYIITKRSLTLLFNSNLDIIGGTRRDA